MAKAKTLALWSATGSTGRSSIAIGLASELARAQQRVLLIDADTMAPSLAVMLGLVDHPAGLASACRLASQGRFNSDELLRLSAPIDLGGYQLRLLTGVSSNARWPEVSVERLESLLAAIEDDFDFIIFDLHSNFEAGLRQQSTGYDRNALNRWVLGGADQIIGICIADQVGISRYLSGFTNLVDLKPRGEIFTLVNRLRSSVLGPNAKQQITETLDRLGGILADGFVPDDSTSFDFALKNACPINLAKRGSPAKQALELFVRSKLLGQRSNLDKRLTKLG